MTRKSLPKLCHHKPSNRGYIYINRKRIYLGSWSSFRISPPDELNLTYLLFLKNLILKGSPKLPKPNKSKPKKVYELCNLFIASNISSGDKNNYNIIQKFLIGMFPSISINNFGPHHLSELQKEFVARGLTRQGINKRINLTRRIFRWGVSQNLVQQSTFEALKSIFPIKKGVAKEAKIKNPANITDVLKTMDFLHPILNAMIKLQLLTGMRPSEVCKLNIIDIETNDPKCWWYKPANHKTSWRGKTRSIPLSIKSIKIIEEFLPNAKVSNGYLFPPMCRDRVSESAGCFYTTSEYGKAIRQAAIRAKIEPWSPNQLRKYAAQKLLEEQGIEAASSLLGHSCVDITRKHYTNQAENKAKLAAICLERLFD